MTINTKFNPLDEVLFLHEGVVKRARVISLKYDTFPLQPEVVYNIAWRNCLSKDEYFNVCESKLFATKEELIASL